MALQFVLMFVVDSDKVSKDIDWEI